MEDGTNATVVRRATPAPELSSDARAEIGSQSATPASTRKFTYSTPAESMRAVRAYLMRYASHASDADRDTWIEARKAFDAIDAALTKARGGQ